MKYLLLLIFILLAHFSFSQKLVFNEIGFKLKDKDRELIERLASYEVKIFNGLFNTDANDSLVLTLNLYNKQKAFKELLKSTNSKGFTESGFYSPVTNESHVLYYDTEEIHTVLHELSHALLRNNLQFPPRWFNEGLAVFLQSLEEKNNTIQVYTQHRYLDYIRELNREGKIDVGHFLLGDQAKWRNKDDQRYMYAMSYGIVYYMIKKDPKLISKMVVLMKKREKTEVIFNHLFGSIQALDKNFKIYYR